VIGDWAPWGKAPEGTERCLNQSFITPVRLAARGTTKRSGDERVSEAVPDAE
jgi:hypothetical protein